MPDDFIEVPYSEDGVDAKAAFYYLDSQGKRVPCREHKLFQRVLTAKKQLNLTIEMWSEDVVSCLIRLEEIKKWCEDDKFPDWVYESAVRQTKKRALRELGFIPTFITNQTECKSPNQISAKT